MRAIVIERWRPVTATGTLWPGKDAIGGTVKMLNETMPRATVVGVVRDERLAETDTSTASPVMHMWEIGSACDRIATVIVFTWPPT